MPTYFLRRLRQQISSMFINLLTGLSLEEWITAMMPLGSCTSDHQYKPPSSAGSFLLQYLHPIQGDLYVCSGAWAEHSTCWKKPSHQLNQFDFLPLNSFQNSVPLCRKLHWPSNRHVKVFFICCNISEVIQISYFSIKNIIRKKKYQ